MLNRNNKNSFESRATNRIRDVKYSQISSSVALKGVTRWSEMEAHFALITHIKLHGLHFPLPRFSPHWLIRPTWRARGSGMREMVGNNRKSHFTFIPLHKSVLFPSNLALSGFDELHYQTRWCSVGLVFANIHHQDGTNCIQGRRGKDY